MKPEVTSEQLVISSSPHAHDGSSVDRIMWDVVMALAPALLAAIFFFGLDALRLVGVCVATCLLTEWGCRKLMQRPNTLSDWSAVVTGLLLAFNLPPGLPSWMAVAGSVFAIAIAKQVFGGLGYNPFNPALAARAFMLISFPGAMMTWSKSTWPAFMGVHWAEAVTTATPLGFVKEALKGGASLPNFTPQLLQDFFLGNVNGCIGETSALALLLGAAYLLYRKVITWHIPVAYILTVFVYAVVLRHFWPETSITPLAHVLSGGLFLGALFMATDMVTSPVTKRGMLVFGLGCGVLTMLIRTSKTGPYPEGVSFAILLMNAFTPLINRVTRNTVFGTVEKKVPRGVA
jgi:Na+-translocating ferredoxin:NAD+ oxidoreductase subunit D